MRYCLMESDADITNTPSLEVHAVTTRLWILNEVEVVRVPRELVIKVGHDIAEVPQLMY